MIDFNWPEITVLAVLAVLMFGPEKLPEFARQAARIIQHLRRIGADARGQLRAELGPEWDNVQLSDLNPKNFISRHLLSAEEKDDLLSIRDEFRSAGELASGSLGDVRDGIEGAKAEARHQAYNEFGPVPADTTSDADGPGRLEPDITESDLLRAVAYDPEAT